MEVEIEPSWKTLLKDVFEKPYFKKLTDFIKSEYLARTIYPKPKNIFAAFNHCPIKKIKVVILGQDPYHGLNQAHGLCFSVPEGVPSPPSLQNIFKEIESDLGRPPSKNGNLERWAKQGVFLLNATLTVQAHNAGSHQNKGWETFTDSVIQKLSDSQNNLVFLLWGSSAGKKEILINKEKHLILKAPHPSPLSSYRGFFGCKHFSKTNEYLKSKNLPEINW